MKNGNPMVSVVVVSYCSQDTILETLDSIYAQTYPNIELIVSDDCSTDDTVSLVQKWAQSHADRFSAFHLHTKEKNLGVPALYFAILKVRPTPFCLLDEIDAALDDRNVERFASYLHNLSKNTQFIVITHRRGTMEASDVLYGVTMQEQGVSKLLRLDLNQMEEYLGIVE